MSDFRKLSVYNKSLDLVEIIYQTCDKYPKEEQFVLVSQLKRAANSICLNIAEGSGRHHSKDFIQFIRIAIGSALELSALFDISLRLNFISKNDYNTLSQKCDEIGKMLSGLINSLTKN